MSLYKILFFSLVITLCSCSGFKQFKQNRTEKKETETVKAEKKGKQSKERAKVFNENAQPDMYFENLPNVRLFYGLNQKELKDSLLFSMTKSACFGDCKAFSINFYESGFVEYVGRHFVKNIGTFNAYISAAELNKLVALTLAIEPETLDDFYGVETTDIQKTTFNFNLLTQPKLIVYNMNPPERLVILENKINVVSEQLQWQKIN